jgi:hypothetical protein
MTVVTLKDVPIERDCQETVVAFGDCHTPLCCVTGSMDELMAKVDSKMVVITLKLWPNPVRSETRQGVRAKVVKT